MAERLRSRGLLGELASEFAGTFILILFGVGVVAQVVGAGIGNHDSIAWAWGFGVVLGVYTAGKIRGFPWRKVAPYALAQTAGAFVAALVVRWDYTELLAKADPGHTIKTQGVFSTLPGNGAVGPVHEWGAFRDQVIGTAILLFLVIAITDNRNSAPGANMVPVVIGFLIVAIGMAWGSDAGYAINPARDFGPRLASFFTGYGTAFRDQYGNFYYWVPIIAPIIGGIIGVGLYDLLIGRHLPAEGADEVGRLPQQADGSDAPADARVQ
jgi:glycerol uptake facilitator protein